MAIFTVTTGTDVSRDDDAFITFREAFEAAAASDGPDTIQFAEGVRNIQLSGAASSPGATIFNGFTIAAGEDLTIDGDTDGDGVADITISGSSATAHFIVESGAALTLRALDLVGGFNDQTASAGRAAAGEATDAVLFDPDAQGADGANGEDAFGSILNLGSLTLEQIGFDGNFAAAQAGQIGGRGGAGADGAAGADGQDASSTLGPRVGEDGSDGANGGDGGRGGDGGNAATVLNLGSLTATGLVFGSDNNAAAGVGGGGGRAGVGGDGGAGGAGGDGFAISGQTEQPREGGDGGAGGNSGLGGAGGDGGAASAGILNLGNINPIGAIAASAQTTAIVAAEGGAGAIPASRGLGGAGGAGGRLAAQSANDGAEGARGDLGAAGSAGLEGRIAPLATTAAIFDTIITASASADEVEEGDRLTFSIVRNGVGEGDPSVISVAWRLAGTNGATAADLGLDTLPSGEVLFDRRAEDAEVLSFDVLLDDLAEGREAFTLILEEPVIVDDQGETVGLAAARARTTIARSEAPPVPGEVFNGTEGDDTFSGTAGGDTMRGGLGQDTLLGQSGDDLLLGQIGDDDLRGQRGDDTLRGAAGDDRLLGNGGEDELAGNGGADELRGGGGQDVLRGGGGADDLKGNRGADNISGNGGADQIFGGGGNDLIFAGGSDDRIEGGEGDDNLTGGRGKDVFVFGATDGDDTINDFKQGADRLAIIGADGFEDFLIRQDGANVVVSFGATDITLLNQVSTDFTADDFLL